jgi:hypothetical protein
MLPVRDLQGVSRFSVAASRLLSGVIVLIVVAEGAAAVAFGVAAFVLLLNRERADERFFQHVVDGLYAAIVAWALLYVRCAQMRLVVPLW